MGDVQVFVIETQSLVNVQAVVASESSSLNDEILSSSGNDRVFIVKGEAVICHSLVTLRQVVEVLDGLLLDVAEQPDVRSADWLTIDFPIHPAHLSDRKFIREWLNFES